MSWSTMESPSQTIFIDAHDHQAAENSNLDVISFEISNEFDLYLLPMDIDNATITQVHLLTHNF